MDPAQILRDFRPSKDFFIGIDSDGCVFDSMEIKHKECFAPMFIKHFGLQAVSKYAREVWENACNEGIEPNVVDMHNLGFKWYRGVTPPR